MDLPQSCMASSFQQIDQKIVIIFSFKINRLHGDMRVCKVSVGWCGANMVSMHSVDYCDSRFARKPEPIYV